MVDHDPDIDEGPLDRVLTIFLILLVTAVTVSVTWIAGAVWGLCGASWRGLLGCITPRS